VKCNKSVASWMAGTSLNKGIRMAVRKRFIAGAVCPSCQAKDSLAMWRENNVDIVECVKCGHQMREADKEARDHVRKDEQVIGIFHPD